MNKRTLGILGRSIASLMALALFIRYAFHSYERYHEIFGYHYKPVVYHEVFMVMLNWGLTLLVMWRFFPPVSKDE